MRPENDQSSAARLWVVLARAHHAVATYMEQSIAGLGIGLTDFAVLEALLHKGPLSMREIARKVLLASASTTSAIDRLSARGLVQRNTATNDRRMRMVELTANGRSAATKLFAQHERDIQALIDTLSPEDQDLLRTGLKQIGFRAVELVQERKKMRGDAL